MTATMTATATKTPTIRCAIYTRKSTEKGLDMDFMLRMLDALYRSRGMVRPGLIRLDENLPSTCAYARQFGSLDQAFQKLFDGERDKARSAVHEQILGFIALPRFGSDSKPMRYTSSSVRTELFGRTDLQFLQQLL